MNPESSLSPGIFNILIDFLDDETLNHLRQENTFLDVRITAEQRRNGYWKHRVGRRLDISLARGPRTDWKAIYHTLVDSVDPLVVVINMFPTNLAITYLEDILADAPTRHKLQKLISKIYKHILQADIVNIYQRFRQLLIDYNFIYKPRDHILQVLTSESSPKILAYIIPDILAERDKCLSTKQLNIFVRDLLTVTIRVQNLTGFIMLDMSITPQKFMYYPETIHKLMLIDPVFLEYYAIRHPVQVNYELTTNLYDNLKGCNLGYSMAKFLISEMSAAEYSDFMQELRIYDFKKLSTGVYTVIATDPRTPLSIIKTQVKPYIYNNVLIYSTFLPQLAKTLNLSPGKLLRGAKFINKQPIHLELLTYLLTARRFPIEFQQPINELLSICNIPVTISDIPGKELSSIEAEILKSYLVNL